MVVGLNVSGLIYRDPSGGIERFKFRSNYRDIIEGLLKGLLAEPNVSILLVGHVGPNREDGSNSEQESDVAAIRVLLDNLQVSDSPRTHVVPAHLSAMELKWVIGQCDWFCGTRMHSCIGGLSQGVPTGAIAYSDKTIGVFESAGVGESVVDPRTDDAETVVQKLLDSFKERDTTRETLQQWLPVVKGRLKDFFDQLKKQIGQA